MKDFVQGYDVIRFVPSKMTFLWVGDAVINNTRKRPQWLQGDESWEPAVAQPQVATVAMRGGGGNGGKEDAQ